MNKATLISEIMQLTPKERRDLVEELLVAVEEDEAFALTPEQKIEIDRRLAEHRRDPGRASSWEEVRERLRARFE
jgi:putative addiction module component (TIGR02574 family)